MSSERDCCCTRGKPRCEVPRGPYSRSDVATSRREPSCYTKKNRTCEIVLFFFFCVDIHRPGRLGLGGTRSRQKEPARATLDAQSTRHGVRPGPKSAPQCTGGAPACAPAGSARKGPPPAEKCMQTCNTNAFGAYTVDTSHSISCRILIVPCNYIPPRV